MTKTIDDLFSRINIDKNDCWLWTGGTHSQGYPMIRHQKQMVLVARYLMQEQLGKKLHKKQRVKNRCPHGHTKCVNPDHYIVAEPGTEEWKCIGHTYRKADVKEMMDAVYLGEDYWGKRSEVFEKYKKKHKKLTTATFWKWIKKYEENY